MSCLGQGLGRTAPMRGSSRNELVPSKPPKVNGWSWPPQAFQVVGWLVYSYLAVVGFGVYIPLLPPPWNHAAYALMGIVFIVHFATHIAAVTIDPADASVRAKQSYSNPTPLFDRTKQPHVIQDLHCYLCDVKVGPKVKHCGICNKCVGDFDHHCRWLNTCVGGRNYWYFFVALFTATLGVFLLHIVILFIFIQHYLDPSSLRTDPQFDSVLGNGTWLVFLPLAPIQTSSAGLLVLAFITVMLSITCLLLLSHLLGFHFYLFYKGMSTYDYIKMQRQKEANRDVETGIPHAAKINSKATQENSIDCEPTLPQSSRTCNSDDKGPFTSRLSESICTELENFKKSAEKENSFHYGTESPTENTAGEVAMSDTKNWIPEAEEEAQSTKQASVNLVGSVPVVQNPLGSSVMVPDDTYQ